MLVNIINALLHIHTVEVDGSNPLPPTMNIKGVPGYAVPPFLFVKLQFRKRIT